MSKPKALVKIFTDKMSIYMYDANKNGIIKISQEICEEINHYLHSIKYSSKVIDSLKRKGYLLDSSILCLEHPFTPFVNSLLQSHLSTLILQVTQQCNFRCRYCSFAHNTESSRTHTNRSMTFDVAKKSIDLLSTHCSDSQDLTISFYGGEPLLNYDLIKQCVEYSKHAIYNKPIDYSMTTNFYAVTDEQIDFLAENKFELLISLDGPENIHNHHRRLSANGSGTYQRVIENVMKIKQQHEDYFYSHVQFNPVVYFDEDPLQIVDFFKTVLGVSENSVRLQRIDDTGLEISYDPIDSSIEDKAEALLNSKNLTYYENVLKNRSAITANYHINGSCVPGSDKLFVSVDGEFFPCEKVNECNKNMQIGSLQNGFDFEKIKYLMNIGYMNQDNCKNCWAIRFCKMCCAHCDDGKSNLSETMLKNKCIATQNEALKYLKNHVISNLM
jgi:uncharacterized protein